jgi:hypothetical protein
MHWLTTIARVAYIYTYTKTAQNFVSYITQLGYTSITVNSTQL